MTTDPTRPKPRLKIIFNPWAKSARQGKVSFAELQQRFGDRSDLIETKSLEELASCLRDLQADRPRNPRNPRNPGAPCTLCFVGGDGTLSQGISTWLGLQEKYREPLSLPPILPVAAGTMNYVSHDLGYRGPPFASIENYLRPASSLRLHEMHSLEVRMQGHPPRWGFFFAWGVGCRILQRYYGRRADPTALTAVGEIAVASFETLRESRKPRSARKLFRSRDLKMLVDGKPVGPPESYSLAIGAMRRICLGISPFAKNGEGLSLALCNMEPRQLLPYLPSLLFGTRDPGRFRSPDLAFRNGFRGLKFQIDEAFTIEGEIYELPASTEVEVRGGPKVRFWVSDNSEVSPVRS